MKFRTFRNGLACLAVSMAAAMAATSAHAALLSGPITVTLDAPGGTTADPTTAIQLTDTVAVADGIHTNDGPGGFVDTNIGGFMLPGEFITFGDATHDINLRLAPGADTGGVFSTGLLGANGNPAQYVFSGLSIANEIITGVLISGTGISSPASLASLLHFDPNDPTTLSLDIDSLILINNGNALNSFADIVLDLQTCVVGTANCGSTTGGGGNNSVPEPASIALVLAGLAGLPVWRRRRAAGPNPA